MTFIEKYGIIYVYIERSLLEMGRLDKLQVSSGVRYLAEGYIDYAEEVISERALVGVLDGLKPVNRRILWTMHNEKQSNFIKSQRCSGNVLAYHPHGDVAVYKASVPMTDRSGAYHFPLIEGSGNFGNVSSGLQASAPRYTEMRLHANASEFLGQLDGVDMIPNFDATLSEPKLLPVSFPNVLVNASEGIAVGFSSKIPSFNFNDVIDLCIEYIDNGECTTVIEPDFVTRGYYVRNNKELKKLMMVGKASLKLRGKVMQEGKVIRITEVPYGKPATMLKKQIDDRGIQNVSTCGNVTDKEGAGLVIECRTKNSVDGVLYDLYKDTDLQYNFNANMVVVHNGVPKTMGVWKIIETWVEWRKSVLMTQYTKDIDVCKKKMRESETFMKLIEMTDIKNEFVNRVSQNGRADAVKWLKEQVKDEIPSDLLDWVARRPLDYYHTGGPFARQFSEMKAELENLESKVADITTAVRDDLLRVKRTYGSSMPRRTEVTTVDYEFAKDKGEAKVDNSYCVYAMKNNFLKKLRYMDNTQEYDYQFEGGASDTLVAFDNMGRVLRVYAQDLVLNTPQEMGVYLPRHLELGDVDDDYKIMWIGRLDGSEKTLLYKDGTVGFLDTSEWLNQGRQVRVLKNGVSQYAGLVGAVLDELPEVLMTLDNNGRVGYVETAGIKHKARTARTRVWDVKADSEIIGYCGCSLTDACIVFRNNMSNYKAPRIKNLEDEKDFNGENVEFLPMK